MWTIFLEFGIEFTFQPCFLWTYLASSYIFCYNKGRFGRIMIKQW